MILCGNDTHKLYEKDGEIFVECTQCKNITIISVSKPELKLKSGDDSIGMLCFMDD